MTEAAPENVDEYVAGFPPEVRDVVEAVRQTLLRAVPTAVESISYGMPTYSVNGRRVLYFAGWKHHVALYSVPTMAPTLEKELANYRKAKGTLDFSLTRPMPYDLIERLARALVEVQGKR
ncbi:DUF1801 domain-containing protein [Cryobacterium melibiosiphilum]|uniref:DUF1801 domain-containing protein n=1 Tax=Cryobacterium melibiosiphilum TaxID=995039 RepID=A0A3A5MEE5_9MICO|nr:DUF1801 domain-containing protein [Cryobacterium melibiosiphilum]RJT87505.1 DUF1801 domain-containing protein [Cryobacterium melibiosiphilum]